MECVNSFLRVDLWSIDNWRAALWTNQMPGTLCVPAFHPLAFWCLPKPLGFCLLWPRTSPGSDWLWQVNTLGPNIPTEILACKVISSANKRHCKSPHLLSLNDFQSTCTLHTSKNTFYFSIYPLRHHRLDLDTHIWVHSFLCTHSSTSSPADQTRPSSALQKQFSSCCVLSDFKVPHVLNSNAHVKHSAATMWS